MDLFDGEHYEPDDVLAHPRHLAMQSTLTKLIQQLRDCDTNESGIAFQHDLLREVLAVQEDRAGFKRAAARLSGRKSVQPGAPEPRSGRDTDLPETWLFEQYVCERLDRQLRSVGDALAWRVFQFHRPFILALCRNDAPGYMHGKIGLAREREEIDREWKENGTFSLLHDLTQCLRIGDITVFNDLTSPETREVKTNPNKMRRAQVERINTARAAALHQGPITQSNSAEFLYELDVPLRTHLDLLREAMNEAADAGLVATSVPGSRALLVMDQPGCVKSGLSTEDFPQRAEAVFAKALNSAGLTGNLRWNVHATTLDGTGQSPIRVPWANYPIHPALCARLNGDYTVITVETSGPQLARLLQMAGLDAQWVRPPTDADLLPNEVVMEIHRQDELRSVMLANGFRMTPGMTLQMKRSELDRYLIELLAAGTWAAGIRYLLASHVVGQPWPHFRNEDAVWR